MVVTLEDLVTQFGTNLLKAKLVIGTQLKFEFYGRICTITVKPGEEMDPPVAGDSAEFEVVG